MSTLRQSTSNESGLSSEFTNDTLTVASQLSTFSPTQSKLSNNFEFGQVVQTNYYTHNNHQGSSSQPFNVNQSMSATDEFDDDISCQEVKPTNEIIYVSSDSEYEGNYVDDNVQKASSSNDKRYCSICKEEKSYNHDCSVYNKEFSTCLVPNCNILFRTIKDFDPHYRQHIGFPTGERLCHWCYKENKKSERDNNGYHICCHSINVFKCYTCNIVYPSMAAFASHKLKVHNARLMNSAGNYLCLYCEKSSQEMPLMDDHIKLCCADKNTNVQKNEIECSTEVPEPEVIVTPVLTNKRIIIKKTIFGEESDNKLENSHKHLLFTCLKPSCNLIFQHFPNFKFHHRQHFQTGSNVMCWQCCTPFSSVASLRIHQVKGNCRTPGMFKCFQCGEGFDDLQSLSIHKYVVHNGELVVQKKNQKVGCCPLCKSHIDLVYFRNHLIQCHSYTNNNMNKSNLPVESKVVPVPKLIKSRLNPCKCRFCNKVCLTAAALSSHIKVHNPNRLTKIINKKINNKNELASINVEINNKTNSTSSTSQNNETFNSANFNMDDTGSNVEVNSTSNTSHVNQSQRFVDYNQITFENGLYSCINCPRKFCTKMGLAKHWPFCKPKQYVMKNTQSANPKRILPKNYYCTDCKEYYTRPSFGTHWRMIHGKKLSLKKCKKYSCTKCPIKFMYKVALVMHYQHVHQEEDSTNNITEDNLNPVDGQVQLPIVSQTISLAKNNKKNCNDEVKNEFNNTLVQSSNLPSEENVSNTENSNNTIETQVVESSSNEPDELNDTENHDDPNMSPNNDTIDNTTNVQNDLTQNDNMSNGKKKAEQLIEIESAMEVDDTNELEKDNRTKSSEKNIIKVVFGNNDKRNMLSVKKEFSQHCFNKSLTNNETQNIYKTRNENYQSPNVTISKDTNSEINEFVDLVNNEN